MNRSRDIFKQLVNSEEIVRIKEELFEEHPIIANMVLLENLNLNFYNTCIMRKSFGGIKQGFNGSLKGIEIPGSFTAY